MFNTIDSCVLQIAPAGNWLPASFLLHFLSQYIYNEGC